MKTKLLILLLVIYSTAYSQFWTEFASKFPDPSRGINQFSIANNNVIWATGYDGSGANANIQELTKSVDGGETWTAMDIDLGPATGGLGISNIFALNENVAWVVAYPNTIFERGGIWKTVDGGTTWSKQTSASYSETGAFPNVVYFWDANNGFCQGDPIGGYYELYTTTDGGENWTRVPSSSIPSPLSGEYGYVRQIEVVGERMWWTTNKGRIYRSDDRGLTHVVFQSPISDFGSSSMSGNISFWNENEGLLSNSVGQMWKTTDGGETWSTIPGVDNVGMDIECVEGTTNAIFTGRNGGSPNIFSNFYSTDGGSSWTLIDNIQRTELEFNSSIGFAGGFNTSPTEGGIFKYTGDELSLSTSENELNILNAYPNPVKNIFTIEAVDIISDISVFNILGQEVITLQPNELTTEIDMTALNSGTYMVKVTVNNKTQTIKLLK